MASLETEIFEVGNIRLKLDMMKANTPGELADAHSKRGDVHTAPCSAVWKILAVEYRDGEEWVAIEGIDIGALIQSLQTRERGIDDREKEVEKREHSVFAQELLGEIEVHAVEPHIQKAAENAGLSVKEWISETLIAACQPNNMQLPVNPKLYAALVNLAASKSISLKELGEGEVSDLVHEALINRYL